MEALGPVDPREIRDIIKEIEAEGNHFVDTPSMPGNWPLRADDPASQLPDPQDGDTGHDCDDGG